MGSMIGRIFIGGIGGIGEIGEILGILDIGLIEKEFLKI